MVLAGGRAGLEPGGVRAAQEVQSTGQQSGESAQRRVGGYHRLRPRRRQPRGWEVREHRGGGRRATQKLPRSPAAGHKPLSFHSKEKHCNELL